MRFDVVINAPMEPRVFRVVAVINGVPCISVTKLDTDNFPSETIKVYCGDGSGNATSQHETSEGLVQEIYEGDYVGLCSKRAEDFPATLNSFYVVAIRDNQVITKNAIL